MECWYPDFRERYAPTTTRSSLCPFGSVERDDICLASAHFPSFQQQLKWPLWQVPIKILPIRQWMSSFPAFTSIPSFIIERNFPSHFDLSRPNGKWHNTPLPICPVKAARRLLTATLPYSKNGRKPRQEDRPVSTGGFSFSSFLFYLILPLSYLIFDFS